MPRSETSSSSDSSDDERRHKKKSKHSKSKHKHKSKSSKSKKSKSVKDYEDLLEADPESKGPESFVWHKKREVESSMGITEADAKLRDKRRREEAELELEKLKQRRAQREVDQALREQEQLQQQRAREMEMYGDLERKEAEFHLEQAKRRAQFRLREGRAMPIDYLIMNNNFDEDFVDISVDEPYEMFKTLDLAQLDEIRHEMELHLELEKDPRNREFWESIAVICESEIERHKGYTTNQNVHNEIIALLESKNRDELRQLQQDVAGKLTSGQPIDVEYWEMLLKHLLVFEARARIKDMHIENLQRKLEILRNRKETEKPEPQPVRQQQQQRPSKRSRTEEVFDSDGDDDFQMDSKDLDEDEEMSTFSAEIALEHQAHAWDDKYRPRKPRFINRVVTGFDWNTYNKTHYDRDNPPPKVVLGYKFNIFYPDLIDKTKTPEYKLEKDPESRDDSTCLIRFHAGPPYEDVAFRIIKKEWMQSRMYGFRCTFDRGILTLNFRLIKYRYRK